MAISYALAMSDALKEVALQGVVQRLLEKLEWLPPSSKPTRRAG